MVSTAGAPDSEGGKGQQAMDMDSSKPTKKIPRNKFVIAYAVSASTISILFGYVGMGSVNWVLGAEIFPLRLRAKAASLGVAVERGMSGVVSMTFLSISKAMTVRRTFYLFLAVSVLSSIFIYSCVPETKGKTLEEIVESFHVKPQECLDKMATDPSELEPSNRRGIPVKAETGGVKAETGGVLTGGAVTITGGAVNVTGGAVNVIGVAVNATGGGVTGGAVNATGGAVNAKGGTVTGGAVNVTAGAVTVTARAVNATGGAVNATGGAATGGAAGGAVTGGAVTAWLVTGGVLTGGAVTGGAVTGGAGGAVTGGAGGAVTGGEVIGTVVIGGVLTGGAVTGGAVTGGVFQ